MPEREEERSGIFDVKKKSNKQSNRQKKKFISFDIAKLLSI